MPRCSSPRRAAAGLWRQEERGPAEGSRSSSPTSNHTRRGALLSRDCQAECVQRTLPSYAVSEQLVRPPNKPSLIRRRCQCANKISSFNIFLKCECFKENQSLVTPWLFLLSATHLPFGQSVPIELHPSSPSTHSPLPAFLVLFKTCYACHFPSLSNLDTSQVSCTDFCSLAPTLYGLVERIYKPVAVGIANLGEGGEGVYLFKNKSK